MQMGGYVKRCLGLNIYFKIETPKGKRIQEFFVGGKRLDMRKTYRACYLTAQGVPTQYGTDRKNLKVRARVYRERERHSPITASYQSPVVPI
jgi:hypothetical protein